MAERQKEKKPAAAKPKARKAEATEGSPEARPPRTRKRTAARDAPEGVSAPASQAEAAPVAGDGTVAVYNVQNEKVSEVSLRPEVFGVKVNEHLLYEAVKQYRAGARAGTHMTKNRALVAGSGRKPWRQKGTGRARAGSRRSPQFTGGGVVFGPQPRSYAQRLPKQMKRLALRGALTGKFDDGAIKVVEDLALEETKTKALLGHLGALGVTNGQVLVIAPARDEPLELSARNIPGIEVILADSLNVVDVLRADTLLFTRAAVELMRALPAAGDVEEVPA
jgi:large subunit ribosomal protein L4